MAACAALAACGGEKGITVGEARPEAGKVGIAWKPRQAVDIATTETRIIPAVIRTVAAKV